MTPASDSALISMNKVIEKDSFMNKHFKRSMAGIERMRLWFPNINVVMAARVKGTVTAEQMAMAIQLARRKHPLLGARVLLDKAGKGWFSTEGVPDNPTIVKRKQSGDDWHRQMKQELKHPWPIGRGPLARFVLLQGDGETDLVVNAHHSICDARSLAYLIRDLLDFVANPVDLDQVHPLIPVPLEEVIPAGAIGGFFERQIMNRMNKKWLRKGISFDETDYREMHRRFWEQHEATILSWSLTAFQTAALINICHQNHVSVNSAVYVAFLTAQSQIQQPAQDYYSKVMVPVDLRAYLAQDVGQTLGLYASAIKLNVSFSESQPFWDKVNLLDHKIKKQLTEKNIFASQRSNQLHPSLTDGIAHAMFGELEDKLARNMAERMAAAVRTGILVSNLGQLDIPANYRDRQLEWIKPPAVLAGNAEKALEVLTINDQMHLTMTFDANRIAPSTVDAVRKEATQLLDQAGHGK
jgi:NRPS condensation-like uncharacterized protein